jgi:hypothetical protein
MAPTSSVHLPPYRGVLVVDCKEFNGNPSYHQPILAKRIPAVLKEALHRSGLDEVWHELRVRRSTGDGYILGVEAYQIPLLVDPYLRKLQEVLYEKDSELRTIDRNLRMRLRVSVHLGPLPDEDEESNVNGCGRPMNDTHRLVDSDPVRAELATTDPDVTFVAAIISQRVYEDVVAAGYTSMHHTEFTASRVEVKEFSEPAWLYVPRPSTYTPGSDPSDPEARQKAAAKPQQGITFHGPVGQNVVDSDITHNRQRNYFGSSPADKG